MKETPPAPTTYIVLEKAAPSVVWRGKACAVGALIAIAPRGPVEARKFARYLAAGFLRVATGAEERAAIARAVAAPDAANEQEVAPLPATPSRRPRTPRVLPPTRRDEPKPGRHAGPKADPEGDAERRVRKLQDEVRRLEKLVRARWHLPELSFGVTLQRLREAKGFSARQLGERCGCDSSLISQLEANQAADPRLGSIMKLAAGLSMTASALIGAHEKRLVSFLPRRRRAGKSGALESSSPAP